MYLLLISYGLLILAGILFVYTQIVVPVLLDAKLFPMFRNTHRKLESDIATLKDDLSLEVLEEAKEQLAEKVAVKRTTRTKRTKVAPTKTTPTEKE